MDLPQCQYPRCKMQLDINKNYTNFKTIDLHPTLQLLRALNMWKSYKEHLKQGYLNVI